MKLREGISIEVLRKEKFLRDESGDLDEERVHNNQIRPQTQQNKKIRKTWVVGEMAEVLDANRWRVGKVAKVLRNERLVVKLFGSIQLKEFHVSSLRVRRVWCENKRSEFVKENNSSNHSNQQEAICEDKTSSYNLEKDKPYNDILCVPVQNAKRSHAYDRKPVSNKGLDFGRTQKKRASKPDSEGRYNTPLTTDHSSSRQFGASNSKQEKETNNRMFSDKCSVASCSLNETADHNARGSLRKPLVENTCHSSDAESLFPALSCTKITHPFPGHKLEVGMNVIHNLELQAYKTTVQALFASGPLSWEQESLLTNLRLSLHISNDEHLLQLRRLLSAQVL